MLLFNCMGFDISTSRIIFIIVLGLFAWLATQLLTKGFVIAVSTGTPTGKRLTTLTGLIKAALSVLIIAIAGFMILEEFGFNLAPLIASAGIVGLAIGFGAQALVKDIISGAFLLVENQFSEGDEVEMNVAKGRLVIAPRPPRDYHLADLVAEIRPGNLHKEIIIEGPRGRELW